MYRAGDKIGHLLGHVTLTYKVTRQSYVSVLHAIDFPDVMEMSWRHCLAWNHFRIFVTKVGSLKKKVKIGDIPEGASLVMMSFPAMTSHFDVMSWRHVMTFQHKIMLEMTTIKKMNSNWKFEGKISKIDKMTAKIKTLGSKKTPVGALRAKNFSNLFNRMFSKMLCFKFI